jgi:hypothetical protein
MMQALYEDIDRAAEHKFHTEYDPKCSECFSGRKLSENKNK